MPGNKYGSLSSDALSLKKRAENDSHDDRKVTFEGPVLKVSPFVVFHYEATGETPWFPMISDLTQKVGNFLAMLTTLTLAVDEVSKSVNK